MTQTPKTARLNGVNRINKVAPEQVTSTWYEDLPAWATGRVAVLIPAHNEAQTIGETVRSLFTGHRAPERVVVMSDNSTDDTVEIARAAGAEVHETVNNSARKAGAINQGLALILPSFDDSDFVMTMDADGTLAADAINMAMTVFKERPGLGGVSGSVCSRGQANILETAQAIEYERGRRHMSRLQGKIHVLSGAAAFFPVWVLREVAEARGTRLPGSQGSYMLESSLTEDYELTLAVRELGYDVRSSKRIKVITDLMPTFRMLQGQRLRWIRGTLDTLSLYGVTPYTRMTMLAIGFALFASTLTPLSFLALLVGFLAFGSYPILWFLLVIPFFATENVICARRLGSRRCMTLALTFIPLWIYDQVQLYWYWRSLIMFLRRANQSW